VDQPERDSAAETAALQTLDRFMETLNRHDWAAVATCISYPHVRLADGRVTIWETPEAFAEALPQRIGSVFEPGWSESLWDEREVIHSSPDKVHLNVQFSRYDAQGNRLASYRSLWIVTRQEGRWGVQARSSFAR
jgi:hypothetical protein